MNPLIQREERKRERAWTALDRWRSIQKALNWAETQSTVRRNDPRVRLKEQARKLDFLARTAAAGKKR